MVEEAQNKKLLCYYMMNNGIIEEQYAIFEKPDAGMMYNLNTLFIRGKWITSETTKFLLMVERHEIRFPIPY